MYTITKTFNFSASHRLTHLGPQHKCFRLHGHNYLVTLTLASPTLDQRRFVEDYGEMKEFQRWLDATLDHRHLLPTLPTPGQTCACELEAYFQKMGERGSIHIAPIPTPSSSAEDLARWFFDHCQERGQLHPPSEPIPHWPWGTLVASVTVSEGPGTSATYSPATPPAPSHHIALQVEVTPEEVQRLWEQISNEGARA